MLVRKVGKGIIGLPCATFRCLYDGYTHSALSGSPSDQSQWLHYPTSRHSRNSTGHKALTDRVFDGRYVIANCVKWFNIYVKLSNPK